MSKPLKTKLQKSGLNFGVEQIAGIRVFADNGEELDVAVGDAIQPEVVLSVGDVVQVQGVTRGKGFTGGVKRHGFAGAPKTHGHPHQRKVGSVGAGTDPGKVWKGKRMPGRAGTDTATVQGLVVLHIDTDNNEVWLSGPIPGVTNSNVKVTRMGESKDIELDREASGLPEQDEVESEAEVTEKKENQEEVTE